MTISEEAVEAAARGMFAEESCDRRQKVDIESNWRGRLDDRDRDEYRGLARAALEAAAPFIAAEAFEQGQKSGIRHATRLAAAVKMGRPDLPGPMSPNPYRIKETS